MMKAINYILLFSSLIFLSACEKDLMTYSGKDSVYFDIRWSDTPGDEINEWPHQNYSLIQFGKIATKTTVLSLCIRVTGVPKDFDRTFGLEVLQDSTTAIFGEEYLEFEKTPVIKAGELSTNVEITLKRSQRMAKEQIVLMLKIFPGDQLSLNFSDYGDSAGHWPADGTYGNNIDASMHKLVINDFVLKPDGWHKVFGVFSETKYRLLMEQTGTTVSDFESEETMPTVRALALGEKFGRYLLEQAALGKENAILEDDGTMMYCNYVTIIGGQSGWYPSTLPDQYYQ